jgi:hypothetical protein
MPRSGGGDVFAASLPCPPAPIRSRPAGTAPVFPAAREPICGPRAEFHESRETKHSGRGTVVGFQQRAALGLFCHYLIAFTATAVFWVASRKLKVLITHSVPAGLYYGILVYTFMGFIVLPLSAYHLKIELPPLSSLARDITIHMLAVGLPISLVVRRFSS